MCSGIRFRSPCSPAMSKDLLSTVMSNTDCRCTDRLNTTDLNRGCRNTGCRTAGSSRRGWQNTHASNTAAGQNSRCQRTDFRMAIGRICCRSLHEPDCHGVTRATMTDAASCAACHSAQGCELDHDWTDDQLHGVSIRYGRTARASKPIPNCCWRGRNCDPPSPPFGSLRRQPMPITTR